MARCGGCGEYSALYDYYKAEVDNYCAMYDDISEAGKQYDDAKDSLNEALATCGDCIKFDGQSPYANNIKTLIKDIDTCITNVNNQKATLLDKIREAAGHRNDALEDLNNCNAETCTEDNVLPNK